MHKKFVKKFIFLFFVALGSVTLFACDGKGDDDTLGYVPPAEAPLTYTITYDSIVSNATVQGSGVPLPIGTEQTVTYDQSYQLYVPVSSGNTFLYWYRYDNGIKKEMPLSGVYTIEGNITLYAEWYSVAGDPEIVYPK